MSDDDILGGRLRTTESQSYWESLSLIGRATFLLVLAFSIYLAGTFSWNYWKKQQDIAYKKATRRRHGIPDSDKRPFNVAYAAARARLEEEERAAQRPRNILSETSQAMKDSTRGRHQTPTWARTSGAQARAQSTKPLNGYSNELANHATSGLPGDINSAQSALLALPFARVSEATKSPSPFPGALHSRRASSRKALSIGPTTDGYTSQSQKRVFEEDADDGELENYYKKTRVEGEDLIDGDNAAMWNMPDKDDYSNHRGSKRNADYFDEEDGEAVMVGNSRDKRARKTSREQVWEEGESLQDAEMMDLSTSMSGSIGRKRGKKRGRPSVLGFGEEDEGDDRSAVSGKRSKRRATVVKGSAGRKGSHDVDDWTDELSSNKSRPRARYNRRGAKKAGSTDESSRLSDEEGSAESDISMNSSSISLDPRCKGRKIGETWETNGVTYKVGPTGERLRQALVKKEKSKFNMPQDSEHPDSLEHLDIFIETWLTDEEYKGAKDRQELAWQAASVSSVPSRLTIPPASASSIPSTPVAKGKNLLWDSTATTPSLPNSPAVPTSARSSASIGSTGQLDVRGRRISLNPFESQVLLSPAASSRRVPGLLVGNQRPNGAITYSKLEKQDLEAEALAKLRQSMKEPEKPSAPAVPSLPLSVAMPPKQDKSDAPKPFFSLVPPAANTTSASTKASTDVPKAPEAPKKDLPPVPLFSATPANSTTNTKTNGPAFAPPLSDPSASNPSAAKSTAPASSFFAPPVSASSNNTTASTTPKAELPFGFGAPKTTSSAPAVSTTSLFPTAPGSGSTTPSATAPAPASTGSSKPSFAFGPTSGGSDSSKPLFPSSSSSSPFGAGPLFPAAGKSGSSVTGGQDKPAAADTSSSSMYTPGGGSLAGRLGGFVAPTAPAPTSAAPASKSSTPSPFGAPSSTGGFSGFGKPAGGDTKSAASTTIASDGSKGTSAPVFNFAAPSTTASSSTSDGHKGMSAPAFGFGAPTTGSSAKPTSDSKSAPLTPTFNFAAPAASGSSTTSMSATNDGKTASAPAFGGFGTSSKPADKTVLATPVKSTPTPTAFGFSAPSSNTMSASALATSSSTANPIFSFGSAKPAAAATANDAASATTVPQTPFKPPISTSSSFAFGANPSTTPAGQPPAKFGFGGAAAAGSSAATPITPTTPVKFGNTGGGGGAFAFSTGTQGTSNAFAPKPAAGASSFGGGNAGPAKPAFGFGSAPTAPSSSSTANGTSTETKSSAGGSGGFTFNFGGNSSAPSPFGAPAGSSNVGGNIFGAPSMTTTTTTTNGGSTTPFTFGKTS